ncbi:MAG: BamA/TamA family outer membrane protein [Bacteroidia bacterium]
MQSQRVIKALCLVIAAMCFFSCSSTKHLKPNEYLLDKNIIKVEPGSLKSELVPIIKQKPNRKILGLFRFHLSVYNLGASGKVDSAGNHKKFNRWLMNTVGEEPIVLDTFLTKKSSKQLKQYMQNIGYFNAEVKDSVVYKKKHQAFVYYLIKSNSPYIVNKFSYDIVDNNIKNLVFSDSAGADVKRGKKYSSGDIQKERDRVTKMLRNNGYFNFSQQYIRFDVDTAFLSNIVNIVMIIDNPSMESSDTTESALYHQRFYLHNIYVIPDYDLLAKSDTYMNRDTVNQIGINFLARKQTKHQFKPAIIEQHIFLSNGEMFRQKDVDLTYRRLQDLGTFRFVNIKMYTALPVNASDSVTANSLDCFIRLTPAKMQDYQIENELTTSGGNIGVAGSISYRNKNIFHGTELFEFKVRGSIESQPNFLTDSAAEQTKGLHFNTYDFGVETNLSFHKFLLPFRTSRNEKTFEPTTRLSAGVGFENQIEYDRSTTRFSIAYIFKKNPRVRHYIYPAELNYVDVTLTDAYEQQILSLNDAALAASYADHLIANGRYSLTFNNQYVGRIENVLFLRFNFEFAGNLFYLWDRVRPNKHVSDSTRNYQRLNVDYAQYVRPDIDFRYYQVFNEHSQLVYRINGGVAHPYGNTNYILFEKSFYAGGSNDNRAYSPYTVGPGGYTHENTIQQFGTIKIAYNIEYRFDIFKILQGAFFFDGGNIWIAKPDSARPLADFNITRFHKELAMGGGIGLRLNFTFFIFRLDAAVPIKDPSRPYGERFVLNEFNQIKDINFNLGIGYPF